MRREALRDDYAPVQGWPVSVTIYQGDAPTGTDQGVVWFEESRLYYLGERTSFGLSPEQTVGPRPVGRLKVGWSESTGLLLKTETAVGKISIDFAMAPNVYSTQITPSLATFRAAMNGWCRSSGEEDGQLPPLTVSPGVPGQGNLFASAIGVTAFWVGFAVIMVQGVWATESWAMVPVALAAATFLLLWTTIWEPRRHWRAWRDRRRLDRSASQ